MAALLHLNGAPGVGKSTLAAAWAARRPGTLVCDIDELRTWVSGWDEDFVGTGEQVRTAALALLSAYLRQGHDVVLPQLVASAVEQERFRVAAEEVGATYVGVVLHLPEPALLERLATRPATPLTDVVARVIEERGGTDLVLGNQRDLLARAAEEGLPVVDATDVDGTLDRIDAAVDRVSR